MKSSKITATLTGACLLLGTLGAPLMAQDKPKPAPAGTVAPVDTAPADQSKTRSRRAAATASPEAKPEKEPATPVVEESPKVATEPATDAAPDETKATPAETPATKQVEETPKVSAPAKATAAPDEISELRDQIEAAGTAAEKTRLQLQLVELLVSKGSKQDAINELHAMTALERFDPQGFYNIGNALARLGDAEGASKAYRKAIEQRKGRYSRAFNNLGVIELRQGRWDQAYEAFMSALRLENFRYAEASYNLGRLYAARGESDLALREWKRAVAVNPEHAAAKQALAGSAGFARVAVAETPVKASPEKSRTVSTPPKPQTVAASSSPRPVKSARPVTLSVDRDTFNYLQSARSSRERNKPEDSVTNYRRVIARMDGYFAPANLELSYVLISLKRYDEAIEVLLPVTQQDGTRYPISYYHMARLNETRGELQLAEENFNRAASFYKNENAQFLLDLSRVREKLGDLQGALTALEEYLALMSQKNLKPDWSDERLASLRGKLAAAPK